MVQPAAVTQPSPSTTSPLPWCTSCTTLSTISGQLIFGFNYFLSIFMIFSDLYRSQMFLIWNWIFSSILQNRPIAFNLLYKIYCIWYIIFHNIFRLCQNKLFLHLVVLCWGNLLLSNNRNVNEVLPSYPGGSGIFCTLFIYQW